MSVCEEYSPPARISHNAERRRAEAEQKRQYQLELEQQIKEKETRRKRELEESREEQQEESFFKFGRPGAGAPFRNPQGQIVVSRVRKLADSDPRFVSPQTYPPPDYPPRNSDMHSLPHPLPRPPDDPRPSDYHLRPNDGGLHLRKNPQPLRTDQWAESDDNSLPAREKKIKQTELARDLQAQIEEKRQRMETEKRQIQLQKQCEPPKLTEFESKPAVSNSPSRPVRPLETDLVRLRNEMIRENQELRESLQQVKEQLLHQRPLDAERSKEQEAREIELFDAFARDPGKHTYEPIARLAAAHSKESSLSSHPVIIPPLSSADKSLVGVSTFLPVSPQPSTRPADPEMTHLDSLIADYLETEKRMLGPASSKGRASRLASRGQMVLSNGPIRSVGGELDTSMLGKAVKKSL